MELTKENASAILKKAKVVLLDMDGVIWRSGTAIPNVDKAISTLQEWHVPTIYVTNNASRTRDYQANKIKRLGIDSCADLVSRVYTSAYAATKVIKPGSKVYGIGEEGMFSEFEAAGITVIGRGHDSLRCDPQNEGAPPEIDREISCVVVGFDSGCNFYKLTYATRCLLEIPGCKFYATNADILIPVMGGVIIPGAGAFLESIAKASGMEPVVIGKPQRTFWDIVSRDLGLESPEDVIMVGDNLDTDIAFGNRCGLKTLLVLSGTTTREMVDALPQDSISRPTYIATSLGDLF